MQPQLGDAVFNYTQISASVEKNLPECQSELIHVLLPVLRAPTMQRRRPTQTAQASVTLGVSGAGCNVTQCGISEQAHYSYFHLSHLPPAARGHPDQQGW